MRWWVDTIMIWAGCAFIGFFWGVGFYTVVERLMMEKPHGPLFH